MDRARRAGSAALVVLVLAALVATGGGTPVLAGVVAWPPSSLAVSEIQTGGSSASDEFVEIANQGAATVDLQALEVVYATSSGSTVTRKATWTTATPLAPGQRILLANAAGSYAAIGDAVYSGGFAATGGAIALRVVSGSVIDAVGWGDATNAFVEGTVAAMPPAGSSLERRPGGSAGNSTDTNDNLADWFVQSAPSPQGIAAPPVPNPGPTPQPSATPAPTPTLEPSPTPTASAAPSATPTPTATPTPSPTPAPTATPSATPTPTVTPAPSASPTPTSSPTPAPTPSILEIADARSRSDGSIVTVAGVLTTPLGALESGRGGFVQDASGGIALYLDASVVGVWPAGTSITVEGEIASRFGQRTLRISEAHLVPGPAAALPAAVPIDTGAAGEADEGRRVETSGTVTASPDELTDGLGVTLDDGSGPLRAVIGPPALDGRTIRTGLVVTVLGPLGQRDSSGTGTAGYRVHATLAGDLEIAEPTPSPTASPTRSPSPSSTPPTPSPTVGPPSPAPTATPSSRPTPAPVVTPTPTPTPTPISIAAARAMPIGSRVTTAGMVIAEAGRMGSPSLIAIGDATGGIVVHGAADAPTYPRGTRLQVSGKLAAPYGQVEIKPGATDVHVLGAGSPPDPTAIDGPPSEALEGRLGTVIGRLDVKPTKSSAGDLSIILVLDDGAQVKVFADASSRVAATTFAVGATYRVTGVVGQRASRSGALDGYRICLRDAADVTRLNAAPAATLRPTASAKPPGAPGSPAIVTIAAALRIDDRDVRIDGVVTVPATLLDATGRRIVVQDGSAGVELLLPTGTAAPPVGTRVRATGRMGVAYGAPRLRADALDIVSAGSTTPTPVVLHTLPGLVHEWRLVTITGRVASVHKLGDRWRAEITVGGKEAVVVGQPGAGIPSTALVEGRMASITGIVRRPYPNASDRRYAVTPRFPADVRLVGAASAGAGSTGLDGRPATTGGANGAASSDAPIPNAPDVDLDELGAHIGALVRVGGLVVDLRADGFTLDDGTAIGRVELRGLALDALPLVEPDDALNAIGRVERAADGPIVVVDDAGRLILSGDPVAAAGSTPPSADPSLAPSPSSDGASQGRFAGLAGPPGGFDGSIAGMVMLLAVSALSVVVTLLRRRHGRRLMAARVADRLAALGRGPGTVDGTPPTPPSESRSAERGPSTLGSA